MTAIVWNDAGSRLFESGVDRGVLYVDTSPGVPWTGLVSITESSEGGDNKAFYIDGIKYLDYVTSEDYAASIEAFTYPPEFGKCDGTSSVGNGLYATQQRRRPFALSYRTVLGNDIDGTSYAYKIHLVYNATARPSQRAYSTLNSSSDPVKFSWDISTKPPLLSGYKPTAHFVIDSRQTPQDLMNKIENILYGTDSVSARMPTAKELTDMFHFYLPDAFYDAGTYDEVNVTDFIDGDIPATAIDYIFDGGAP